MKIKYETSGNDSIIVFCLTKCPRDTKGYDFKPTVGSVGCEMCKFFRSKDSKTQIVDCSYGEKENQDVR